MQTEVYAKVQTAVFEHTCDVCHNKITAGQTYWRVVEAPRGFNWQQLAGFIEANPGMKIRKEHTGCVKAYPEADKERRRGNRGYASRQRRMLSRQSGQR
jgi:hypothetical protein